MRKSIIAMATATAFTTASTGTITIGMTTKIESFYTNENRVILSREVLM